MDDIDRFVVDLSDPDRLLRCDALWGLMNLGRRAIKAIAAIRPMLTDEPEPFVRLIAAGSIIRILGNDVQARTVLIDILDHQDCFLQLIACRFLGHTNDPSVLPLLKSLLQDDDLFAGAAEAISMISDDWSYTVEAALRQLATEDELIRNVGWESLIFLGRNNEEIIPILRARLNSLPWDIRIDAEELLHILKSE